MRQLRSSILLVFFVSSLAVFADEDKVPVPIVPKAPLAPGESTPRDAFRCQDANGTQYKIRLTKEQKALIVTKKGSDLRLFPLSNPNVGLTVHPPEKALVYNGWNGDGKDLFARLELGTEVITEYGQSDGAPNVTVTVLVDHQEPPQLSCTATGFAVPTQTNPPQLSLNRITRPLLDAIDELDEGKPRPILILGAQTTLRRFVKSAGAKQNLEAFQKTVAPHLKKFDGPTKELIAKKLTLQEKNLWDSLLR